MRSVTLQTSKARQVADIVGVSHGSKGKRSSKGIDAGKDSRDEVTFGWLLFRATPNTGCAI